MKYRKLGDSDLDVSEISLGSWLTYGVGVEADKARACLEEAFAEGIETGHQNMPQFRLERDQIGDVIAYLKTLER